jgi:hypothetical protein
MRIGRMGVAAVALASLAAVTAVLSQIQPSERFPHEQHARLFPLCEGCHEGIPTGDVEDFYPDPALCARCHDGVREATVDWTGPARPVTNLDFSHPRHDDLVTDRVLDCTTCHTPAGAPRMRVELAVASQCFDCHAHEARDHYVDANCTTCHVPLAETTFRLARVAVLPIPVTHEHPRFLAELHGELALTDPARCSTCHTRELCTSCHVDVPGVPVIAQLPPAGPRLELPRFVASYPVPPSHLDPRWEVLHARITEPAECSTCHTRESCATCHQERLPRVAAALPSAARVEAPGVITEMRAPASHLSPSFAMRHGAVAATRKETCTSCHVQSNFCAACHSPVATSPLPAGTPGEVRLASSAVVLPAARAVPPVTAPSLDTIPRRLPVRADVHVPREGAGDARLTRRGPLQPAEFHPPGFATRHSAAAYGRRLDCQQCHNPRLFCRDCHTESGFEAAGRLGAGFHDAQPMWLLRHGQAARQTLESCTTCHAQRDCLQCHSSLGAFRVNPHRTGFDARAAQRRNPAICLACHATEPLGRSTP